MKLDLLSYAPPAPSPAAKVEASGLSRRAKPGRKRATDAAARFAEFDAENPEAWALFQRFTLDRIKLGFKHYSSSAILRRIRWEADASTDDGSGFKIISHFTAFYVRKFHHQYPEHAGFLRTRRFQIDRNGPPRDPSLPRA